MLTNVSKYLQTRQKISTFERIVSQIENPFRNIPIIEHNFELECYRSCSSRPFKLSRPVKQSLADSSPSLPSVVQVMRVSDNIGQYTHAISADVRRDVYSRRVKYSWKYISGNS